MLIFDFTLCNVAFWLQIVMLPFDFRLRYASFWLQIVLCCLLTSDCVILPFDFRLCHAAFWHQIVLCCFLSSDCGMLPLISDCAMLPFAAFWLQIVLCCLLTSDCVMLPADFIGRFSACLFHKVLQKLSSSHSFAVKNGFMLDADITWCYAGCCFLTLCSAKCTCRLCFVLCCLLTSHCVIPPA